MLAPVICSQLTQNDPHIKHGFFTREGGVSSGIYDALNIGPSSKDEPENVRKNRRAIVAYLGLNDEDVTTPWQHHSPDAVIATHNWANKRPKADAVVTNTPGLPIGIVTADCGPVLFCDGKNQVIAAAHSGWRGATSGILETTIKTMEEAGAQREHIRATLGPTISVANYEVGPEFVENLLSLNRANSKFLDKSTKGDHAMFDLPGYIIERLENAGVSARWTGHCTYQDEDRFFSYRRMTHRKEPDYGRQMSAIAIIKE